MPCRSVNLHLTSAVGEVFWTDEDAGRDARQTEAPQAQQPGDAAVHDPLVDPELGGVLHPAAGNTHGGATAVREPTAAEK